MTDPTDHLRSRSHNLEEAREDRAEAAEHYDDAASHRSRAAADRAEAARDSAEGDPLESLGNKIKAKGHDMMASGHEAAGRHDQREAADEAHAARTDGSHLVGERDGYRAGAVDRHVHPDGQPHSHSPGAHPVEDHRRDGDGHTVASGTAATEGLGSAPGTAGAGTGGHSLLGEEHHRRFRSRWDDIQASFIDSPRDAVSSADKLVREATEALHSLFERDRRQLEGVWDRGDDVSTEDLRVTLQRYRSFFERLLSL